MIQREKVVEWWKRLAKGYCVVFLPSDVLFSLTFILVSRHFFHLHLKLLPWFQISYSGR